MESRPRGGWRDPTHRQGLGTCIPAERYAALPAPEARPRAAVAQRRPRPLWGQLIFDHFPKMKLEAAKVCVTTIMSQGLVSSLHPEPLVS